jgi:MOSC domain-containing protein YiiM
MSGSALPDSERSSPVASGELATVNVGAPRTIEVGGRMITTSIWKDPIAGRVPVRGVNLQGDDQADRSVHGGPDKAVYAYALEDTAWFEQQTGKQLGPGAFGENLSVRGLDLTAARVGEIWSVGTALLEVRQPRLPCFKLGLRMDDPTFPRRFAEAGRPGAYLAIVQEGDVGAGDRIDVLERPDHDVTVGLFAHALVRDRTRLPELLAAPRLPDDWRDWIEQES